MSEIGPPEEQRELSIEDLDLPTLYFIRDKLSERAAGLGGEILTQDEGLGEEIVFKGDELGIIKSSVEKRITQAKKNARSEELVELAKLVDNLIIEKEDRELGSKH